MTDQRKSLAGRSSEHTIYWTASNTSPLSDFSTSQPNDGSRDDFRFWEVEFVNGTVYWVYFNCCDHIETSLFESETETASPGEQFDSDRSFGVSICRTSNQFYPILFLSMNLTNFGVSFFASLSSHCQIVNVRQPRARSSAALLASRCWLAFNFGPQYSSRDLGSFPLLHP